MLLSKLLIISILTTKLSTVEYVPVASDINTSEPNEIKNQPPDDFETTGPKKYEKMKKTILNDILQRTRDVKIENYPYIVSIQKNMVHSCCGTIVSDSWILTAAHCLTLTGPTITFVDITKIAIVAGQTRLGFGKMQLKRVKNVYVHSHFVKKMYLNDIGMINLYEPFELNDFVKAVPLASSASKPYKYYESCHLVSWTVYRKDFVINNKLLSQDEEYCTKHLQVPVLQMIDLPTITHAECSYRIEAKEFLTLNHLCTEYGTFKNVACYTDAGSPLICGDRQYGIFSWGIGCDHHINPGVFTKIAAFRKWIDSMEIGPDDYISRNSGTWKFPKEKKAWIFFIGFNSIMIIIF